MKDTNNCNLQEHQLVSTLLSKIYNTDISKEEIEKQEIDQWQKEVLLIAWYERVCKFKGVPFIKELKKKYETDPDKTKILKQLLERLKTKGKLSFDTSTYANYLQINEKKKKVKNVSILVIPENSVSWKKKSEPSIEDKHSDKPKNYLKKI